MVVNLSSPTTLSGLYFVYYGGARLEQPGQRGITHLCEHLFTKNFDTIEDTLEENGIEWNAYTAEDHVLIYFTGLERYLAPLRKKILALSTRFTATPEDVEKEKAIVLEEYGDQFTDPSEVQRTNYLRRRFGAYSAIGVRQDIEQFTHQQCLDCYAQQYQYPDKIINVSASFQLRGDFQFANRESLIRDIPVPTPEPGAPQEPGVATGEKSSVLYVREVDAQDYAGLMFLNRLMCNGLNSPLYAEIREKRGLVYGLDCGVERLTTGYVQIIMTDTAPENVKKIDTALRYVLKRRDSYLTSRRVERVRKAVRIALERRAMSLYAQVDDYFDADIAAAHALAETVTLEELRRLFDKYFVLDTYERLVD